MFVPCVMELNRKKRADSFQSAFDVYNTNSQLIHYLVYEKTLYFYSGTWFCVS